MNAIFIRRRSKVVVPEGEGQAAPLTFVASLQKNLENLGFILGPDVIEKVKGLNTSQIGAFYRGLVSDLQSLVGAHQKFEPFYPNFPRQVMQMAEAELYLNALIHYWTLERPEFTDEIRAPLKEGSKLRVLSLGSSTEFEQIFTILARSKVSFSPEDRADIKWYIAHYSEEIYGFLPGQFPNKENLALIGAELIRHTVGATAFLDEQLKTATDVLRLAVAMSEGDVSLATACKFGKYRRRERDSLLRWVERASNRTEDMLRWKTRWTRLGERLHPGEYSARYPQTAAAFHLLRNGLKITTFNGQIEAGLNSKNTSMVLDLLETRPGDLARRADHLARMSPDPEAVVERFSKCAEAVSTSVLLKVMTHFHFRGDQGALRVFFPKGNVGNLFATTRPLPYLSPVLAEHFAAISEQALVTRFSKLPALGSCYLDARLVNYKVPFSQRSASKSLRTLVRGSRMPLPEGDTLRFFVWWQNGKSRVDIDLSAAMYDAECKYVDTLSYYNLKNFGACHSGDIVDAPQGAAEFVDVSVERCRERGVRFVVMCLSSYTQQAYCDLPECFAGWMARAEPGSGEIFEPKTVADKVDIASDTRFCLPAIFDLMNREVIWADVALTSHPRFPNNVHHNLGGVSLILRSLLHLRKTDLHTLFGLHIRARGKAVPSFEFAQTVFAVDRGITPFDGDEILANYL